MKHFFLLLALSAVFSSCSHKAEHVEKAFYYWKSSNWRLEGAEHKILETCNVKKLYIKFFEVEHSDILGNIPVEKSNLYLEKSDSVLVVPTVYIRNEVFKICSHQSLDSLADNVNFLIGKYKKDEKLRDAVFANEFQIDCDWTLSTKDNYFYFLKKLKKLSGVSISCTLRLYPYKYPEKMGVPPVDKAMLMCYNLINPLEQKSKNSILDVKELTSYLNKREKYPLHLDVALPVYSWVQVYHNNHFANILYTDTQNIKKILKAEKPMWYQVQNDTLINDFYLRMGDKVKIEEINAAEINEAIDIIKKNSNLDETITISLFHLDAEQLSHYTNEEITGFFNRFTE
jgi:hypothetical protein